MRSNAMKTSLVENYTNTDIFDSETDRVQCRNYYIVTSPMGSVENRSELNQIESNPRKSFGHIFICSDRIHFDFSFEGALILQQSHPHTVTHTQSYNIAFIV